jgi:hypothetical protein
MLRDANDAIKMANKIKKIQNYEMNLRRYFSI